MQARSYRVLLTGGLGFLGSHVAVTLHQAGHSVVILDNLANSDVGVLDRLETILCAHIPFIECDVRSTSEVTAALVTHEIDAVVHFAGLKAVGESVEKPLAYYDCNIVGAISLLQAMQSAQVKLLVFSSSATVYGDPIHLPIDETHPTNATSPYGRTKLHIEEMLVDIARSDADWRIACLRYFNPVGAHESGLIGENPQGHPNNLMPYIARVAQGALPFVNVFGGDYPTVDGTGVRDYIHVMDLAEGHLAAVNYLTDHNGWHAFNLGTGHGYSVLEMIEAFQAASGCYLPYEIVGRRPGDHAICYANAEKAHQLMGWVATRRLHEMCASTWNFQRQHA